MAPKRAAPRRTTRLNPGAPSDPNQAPSTTTTTITNAQLQAMIDQGVTVALAARDANRTGDDNHTLGTGGTEGVVELTQWFERMETVFRISNCLAENQTKFAICTLLAGALTWWNSHIRIVGSDAAYVMTWIELKKKMVDKYCPRNEMKKIETELWNLEVQGVDVVCTDKTLIFYEKQENLAKLCNVLVVDVSYGQDLGDCDYFTFMKTNDVVVNGVVAMIVTYCYDTWALKPIENVYTT
nr:hypothetical protein [Tanacetum cinerariifolium]